MKRSVIDSMIRSGPSWSRGILKHTGSQVFCFVPVLQISGQTLRWPVHHESGNESTVVSESRRGKSV